VENTGDKLSPQILSTLSEPFQRGSQRATADAPGVGLGLAIVKRIAQAHDGIVTLALRPEGGLRVTVHRPRRPLVNRS
jgi:two-component system sensor histidine kinase VanS